MTINAIYSSKLGVRGIIGLQVPASTRRAGKHICVSRLTISVSEVRGSLSANVVHVKANVTSQGQAVMTCGKQAGQVLVL